MLHWHRALIRLRRATPCLNNGEPGNVRVKYDEAEKWLRMERGSIAVLCNLGSASRSFSLTDESELLLASRSGVSTSRSSIELSSDTVAIVRNHAHPIGR
jgi:maltooligosyltrehalose trehalohydrolase